MKRTQDINIPISGSLRGKPDKGELLQLLRALDPRLHPPKTGGGPGNRFSLARKSRITRDLLRRHFVLRVAQITGVPAEKRFEANPGDL